MTVDVISSVVRFACFVYELHTLFCLTAVKNMCTT